MRETVPGALAGPRLDRVVAMLGDTSRATARDLIAAGGVEVDGTPVTTRSRRVAEGEALAFEVPAPPPVEPEPDPAVEVPVVHEDPHVLVVDKPAGLVVHPGAGRTTGTLVSGLLARFPEIAGVGEPDRPGIVHRLDRGTSGLLLVARSVEAHGTLVAMLAARQVERRYRALVRGRVESPSGVVEAPVGRSSGDRTRMAVTRRGRPAVTRYEVLARYGEPVAATEVACTLETGRTHQIRVHLASIGHPVVGDDRYGGTAGSGPALDRPWLHAEHLRLAHPVTGEDLVCSSPLPGALRAVLDGMA